MIAPSSLRIGNILSVCYEEELQPYSVEILQADLVHLADRKEADDPRDLYGLPLTKDFLLANNFEEMLEHNLFITQFKKIIIRIEFIEGKTNFAWLCINQAKYPLNYIHELQNQIFFQTGWEMKNPFINLVHQ